MGLSYLPQSSLPPHSAPLPSPSVSTAQVKDLEGGTPEATPDAKAEGIPEATTDEKAEGIPEATLAALLVGCTQYAAG